MTHLDVVFIKAPCTQRAAAKSKRSQRLSIASERHELRRDSLALQSSLKLAFDVFHHQARLSDLRISYHPNLEHNTARTRASSVCGFTCFSRASMQTHLFLSSPPDD